jgi:HEAT repeat protein
VVLVVIYVGIGAYGPVWTFGTVLALILVAGVVRGLGEGAGRPWRRRELADDERRDYFDRHPQLLEDDPAARLEHARLHGELGFVIAALSDPGLQMHAATQLGYLRDARVVPALVAQLPTGDREYRALVVHALGEIGDPAAIPALQSIAARDEEASISLLAFGALTSIGDPEGSAALARSLVEPGVLDHHRWASARLISARATSALPVLQGGTHWRAGPVHRLLVRRTIRALHSAAELESLRRAGHRPRI